MDTYISIVLLVIGLLLLVVGYRKNNRNILALSALILLASGAGADFVAGFRDGVGSPIPVAAPASPSAG